MNNNEVWEFVNSIVEFNRYTNSPIANYKGKQYNLPFNMNAFYQMWGVLTPDEAKAKIEEQKAEAVAAMKAAGVAEPRNLEEQALMLIGKDIYEALIKGYTEKQWGRKCTEGGYNKLIDGLLEGVDTLTDVDFFKGHTDSTDLTDSNCPAEPMEQREQNHVLHELCRVATEEGESQIKEIIEMGPLCGR